MVTVRRDIAESSKRRSLSQGRTEMSGYDRYVLENEAKAVARSSRNEKRRARGTYESYLMEQMNRTEPERLLTESEYYGAASAASSEMDYRPSGRKHLSKNGKIFLAVYCVAVLVIAIVILVTGLNAGVPLASANAETPNANVETVKKMVVEDEPAEESGWFEELCRSVK